MSQRLAEANFFDQDSDQVFQLKQELDKASEISVLSHKSPDGDSVGSSLGLSQSLRRAGFTVNVITPDPAPKFLHWMEGFDSVINFEEHSVEVKNALNSSDWLFCLDFNGSNRVGEVTPLLNSFQGKKVMIDHHREPEDFVDYSFSYPEASSTSELIFQFLQKIGWLNHLSIGAAANLYVGIMTDTGSFRFSSVAASTHLAVAKLIELGIQPHIIHQNIFDSFSKQRLLLWGFALHNKMEFMNEVPCGIIALTEEELEQYNYQKGDTEGLVNYPLSVEGIQMAALITRKDGSTRLSLRSKGDFSVRDITAQYFNGGGHKNAAGGASDKDVPETLAYLKSVLISHKNDFKNN